MTSDEIVKAMNDGVMGDNRGKCAEFTAALVENFPELKRVRGFVTLKSGLRRSHWWCVDADGNIVDPTASQFETEYFWHAGIAFYEPLNESDPEPTGKCPNCGNYCYDGGVCCSPKCNREYAAYVSGGI